jgi:hypothetical protein
MQAGSIAAGDEAVAIGIDDCTWLIAPTRAANISIRFSLLNINTSPPRGEKLFVDACKDLSCTAAIALPGSPYIGTTLPVLGLIPYPVVRVRYYTMYSVLTGPSFVLHYSAGAQPFQPKPCISHSSTVWTHVAFSAQLVSPSDVRAELIVNGVSLAIATTTPAPPPPPKLAVSGDLGLAIGRVDLSRSAYGYFTGGLGVVRIWDSAKTESDINDTMNNTCLGLAGASSFGLVACFGFENDTAKAVQGIFVDSGAVPASNAAVKSGLYVLPWCTNLNDGGQLLNGRGQVLGSSWGYCAARPRLPGLGFGYGSPDYPVSEVALVRLAGLAAADALDEELACGVKSLHFQGNKAGR